jgi:hypothetical protein
MTQFRNTAAVEGAPIDFLKIENLSLEKNGVRILALFLPV